jgi:hypothetical protein
MTEQDDSSAHGTEDWKRKLSPAVRRLLGAAAGGPDKNDYQLYLMQKYGATITGERGSRSGMNITSSDQITDITFTSFD